MIDYTIYPKTELPNHDDWPDDCQWDVFISAFSLDERVGQVYLKAGAARKYWLILPEYNFRPGDIPAGNSFVWEEGTEEAAFVTRFWDEYMGGDAAVFSLCIDATGFLPPYLACLIKLVREKGIAHFDVIYSEPEHYLNHDGMECFPQHLREIRQIIGFTGENQTDIVNDLLIINAGNDRQLIARIALHKDYAKRIYLYGFPPHFPGLYQENILSVQGAEAWVGDKPGTAAASLLAPANDPFVTAKVISMYLRERNSTHPVGNLYLCALAAKPQLLGMVLFCLWEGQNRSVSLLYPFCTTYPQRTSSGLRRVWKYALELPPSS
jgi:hypothetical protein